MNFEEYVKDEFKNGEKKFDKIETRLEIIHKQLTDIEVALKVDEKMRASKQRNSAMLYGGIMSIIVGVVTHLLKGVI
jgi:predicted metalloenzyme YecM